MIHVGLIGFGFSGRTFHAPVIRSVPGMRLAAVLRRGGGEAGNLDPDVRRVRTMEELLAIEEISLAVIATPNDSHFDLARQCLLAGRHVIVDKPFTTTWREASGLLQLAQQCGRLISVYQNSRWHGDFLTIRRLLDSGALGRLVLYEAHFDRYRPHLLPGAWRERPGPGAGVFFDLGPHLIDQAFLLFGAPDAVSADVRLEREGALVDDAFDVVLYYPSWRAALRAGMIACGPGPRFLLHGTRGSYVKYGIDPQAAALTRGETPGGPGWGEEPQEKWGVLSLAQEGGVEARPIPTEAGDYRRYYENVRDALLGNAALDVTPQQAMDVMRTLELARESSRQRHVIPWG